MLTGPLRVTVSSSSSSIFFDAVLFLGMDEERAAGGGRGIITREADRLDLLKETPRDRSQAFSSFSFCNKK